MANNKGVSSVNNVSGELNWSFGQSLFFSSTVVTTIGELTLIKDDNLKDWHKFHREACRFNPYIKQRA